MDDERMEEEQRDLLLQLTDSAQQLVRDYGWTEERILEEIKKLDL